MSAHSRPSLLCVPSRGFFSVDHHLIVKLFDAVTVTVENNVNRLRPIEVNRLGNHMFRFFQPDIPLIG